MYVHEEDLIFELISPLPQTYRFQNRLAKSVFHVPYDLTFCKFTMKKYVR
jgi:hypothetical protein